MTRPSGCGPASRRLRAATAFALLIRYAATAPTVTVEVEDDGADVVPSVADEGSGVPPDERELILEPFSRGSGPFVVRLPAVR